MTHPLDRFTGVSLAGKYRLEECVAADGAAAFFPTSYGPRRQRALLKLLPEDCPAAGRQLERWRRAALLSHPNLLALVDCGRVGAPSQPNDGSFLYALFEYPDETLAGALEHRPLTEEEARGVFQSVSAALRYIHSQSLVHGAVDAGHIVAVGDLIKLTSDTIREPGRDASPAGDLRALEGLLPRPEPAPPAADPPPVPQSGAPPSYRTPRWTYAGLAAPVVALVAVLLARTPVPRDPDPIPLEKPAPPPAAPPHPAAAPAVAPDAHRVWRVVAYTYGTLRDADRQARRINEKWPAFRAAVFAPKGRGQGPFYVALGGRMTRPEAQRLERTARASGLPRDTFVRNYAE
jgi:hypothetical protein